MKSKSVKPTEYGDNTIKLSVHFDASKIADEPGHVRPKHCRIRLGADPLRGIQAAPSEHFRSLDGLIPAIQKLLARPNVVLHDYNTHEPLAHTVTIDGSMDDEPNGNWLHRVHNDDRGQGLVEYLLILALVAFACTAGMTSLASFINTAFSSMGSLLNTYIS